MPGRNIGHMEVLTSGTSLDAGGRTTMERTDVVTLAQLEQDLEFMMMLNLPVMIWGTFGIGKSDMVRQISNRLFKKDSALSHIVDFRALLRDPVDLRGLPVPDMNAKKAVWLSPDDLPNEKRDGKEGTLFLDEINAAHTQVQAALYGLVLDRKLGDYRLPDGWRIVAAGNYISDRSAAQKMPRALANRFAHYHAKPDAMTWVENYGVYHCHPVVVAFLRFRPSHIHVETMMHEIGKTMNDLEDDRAMASPRSIARVSDVVSKASNSNRFRLVRSLVGEAWATAFEGFYETFTKLPDLEDIIRKPKTAPIPDEPSALYALSSALSRYADRDNFANIMTYAKRFADELHNREYEVIVALDATKRDPMLTKTKAYIEFTKRNEDLMLGRKQKVA